jgi:hypothetical protein
VLLVLYQRLAYYTCSDMLGHRNNHGEAPSGAVARPTITAGGRLWCSKAEGSEAASSDRRCSQRGVAELQATDSGAPSGRRSCERQPAVLLAVVGGAVSHRWRCSQRQPALLPRAAGLAATGGRRCYFGRPALLPQAASCCFRWSMMPSAREDVVMMLGDATTSGASGGARLSR